MPCGKGPIGFLSAEDEPVCEDLRKINLPCGAGDDVKSIWRRLRFDGIEIFPTFARASRTRRMRSCFNLLNMKVAVIMGSTSDYDIMSAAIQVLEDFGIEYEKKVISAHRTPDLMCEYAKSARERGIGVIIAGAGGAAHVAGVVAGMTTVPVIGVPIQTKALGGMDSLLSIVQMPGGIPVATMAINGAKNAGLLAAEILALSDEGLQKKLSDFRQAQTQKVLDAII